MSELFIHVGYPKTATTTFQKHVFPTHEEIDYLGKFIPSFRYCDERLFPEIDKLMTTDSSQYTSSKVLRELVDHYRRESNKKVMLISSESFIHVTTVDLGVVAQRIKETFSPCKILITIREQRDIIKSFYGSHGRYAQYLFLCKDEFEKIRLPLSMDKWLSYCFRAYHKNFLSTLHYYETIQCYYQLFGREQVGVFLFEEFVRDKPTYIRKLCEFLGVNFEITMRLAEGKHELPNLSKTDLFYYRMMSLLSPILKFEVGTMNRPWAKPYFRGKPETVKNQIGSEWVEKVNMLYKEGNRALIQRYGLPLDSFNYLH